MPKKIKISLSVDEMPTKWYNILPDLPEPLPPPKDPEYGESRIKMLPNLLVKECLNQEYSDQRWIDIPEEVVDLFQHAGRPRALFRATNLEEKLKTPAKMYYKSEFYSPPGSHKLNTALAQAYYAKKQGIERLTTESGAGQWGSALSYAGSMLDMDIRVYWVRAVSQWKEPRRTLMELYGAEVCPSPSDKTETGRKFLKENPNHPGSLGIAVSEGLEDAKNHENTRYCLGSVLNHVILHQSIIGLETEKQFEKIDEYPDIMTACLGGGSNFGGFVLPFLRDRIKGKNNTKFIAAQSWSAPNLQGEYRYDFGDYAGMTPLLKMYTLGHQAETIPIKGDGLRYHAAAPIISLARKHGLIDTIAYPTDEKYVFRRAQLFLQTEGFLPAPESAYAVACAIDEALECKRKNEEKVIAFNISGHGYFDTIGYKSVLGEEMNKKLTVKDLPM